MKTNNYHKYSRHADICMSNLVVASIVMTVTLNSCQDYEYGFSEAEVHQEAVAREYKKEFQKAFPNVDPHHSWMCEPDTVWYETGEQTRALAAIPSMTGPLTESPLEYSNEQITAALGYMAEGEDNRGKCAQSFEYLAIEDTEYDIYPVFWGRKFCDNNTVGVYYIDDEGKKQDLVPNSGFWSDQWQQITAVFADGTQKQISQGEYPINEMQTADGRSGGDWNKEVPLVHKCERSEHRQNKKCPVCNSRTAKEYPVEKFILPHFKLSVAAGTKWGLYLRTRKQQSNSAPFVNWYSNAEYNADHVSAAATFTFGNVTYCSFEDAPHNTHNGSGTGTCSCGYGHYDTDFNDIVLVITPRPVETTYRALKYRVMCEDLGGTFDWDFNDVVYDVIYEDGKGTGMNATLSIVVQAVGGTLPVRIAYRGNTLVKNGKSELHELLANQTTDAEGFYDPINVDEGRHNASKAVTIMTQDLGFVSDPDIDVRGYVRNIAVLVDQADGETTTQVVFPLEEGDNIPQCFMTSTGTEWSDELRNIADKYPLFRSWVSSQNDGEKASSRQTTDWWSVSY